MTDSQNFSSFMASPKTRSTHGGEDIHGQWTGKIAGKQEETRSLENMKKPEERKERKEENRKEQKNCFGFPLVSSSSNAQLPFFNPQCMDMCWYL